MIKNVNPAVRRRVQDYIVEPYRLSREGAQFVVSQNEQLSTEYFEHLLFPVSPFWRKYFREKTETLPPANRGVMLDVCCGTGTLCLNVFPDSGFRECYAIDNSERALEVLRHRLGNISGIRPLKADISRTAFGDGTIDAIFGNSFLHHLPDNPEFLKEMYRILAPGGTMVFTGEPTIGAAFLENAVMQPILSMLYTLRLKSRPRPGAQPVTDIWLYDHESLGEMLRRVGFVDVKIHGFGVLVPLLNWPTALIMGKLLGRSMQPDWYWKLLGAVDAFAFSWLPLDRFSHFVIAARKPVGD